MSLRRNPELDRKLTEAAAALAQNQIETEDRIARLVDPVGTQRAVAEVERDLKRLGLFRANNE